MKPWPKKLLQRKQQLKRPQQKQNLKLSAAVPAERQKSRQPRMTSSVTAMMIPSMKKSQSLNLMFRRLLFAEKAKLVTRQ